MEVRISVPLALAAGVVSFLSPCVLPVVPSYLAFVSGLSLEELTDRGALRARRVAAFHAVLFVAGFALVFMTLGLVATSIGAPLARALPWVNRAGGVVVVVFGLHLAGWLPVGPMTRELRPGLTSRPAGMLGSVVVGIAFGAGWTPCIGPILGSILLYTSLDATALRGLLLLAAYALGLGVPFVASALALDRLLTGSARLRSWSGPLQKASGTVLVLIGVLMVSGRFTDLTAFLAGMGQLINLDAP